MVETKQAPVAENQATDLQQFYSSIMTSASGTFSTNGRGEVVNGYGETSAPALAVDGLPAARAAAQDAITSLQGTQQKHFHTGEYNRTHLEQGINSIFSSVEAVLAKHDGKLFTTTGITKVEECAARVEALNQVQTEIAQYGAGLVQLGARTNEIVGAADRSESNLTAKIRKAFFEASDGALNGITDYVKAINNAIDETRKELGSIERRFGEVKALSDSMQFTDHGPGFFTATVLPPSPANLSPAGTSAQQVAASPAPTAGPEAAPAAASLAVEPTLKERLSAASQEARSLSHEPLVEQAKRIREVKNAIAEIHSDLEELSKPRPKPGFYSFSVRPFSTIWNAVSDYFERRSLNKELAKQEKLLNEARYGRTEIRQAGLDSLREKFADTRFTVPQGNPEGIPAMVLRASIPASKVDTLISFSSLASQAAEGASKRSVTVKPHEGSIRIEQGEKEILFVKRTDGRVWVYADQDGQGLKRIGSAWNDDALKLAKKFLEKGEVTFTRIPYEAERVIPKSKFLEGGEPSTAPLAAAAPAPAEASAEAEIVAEAVPPAAPTVTGQVQPVPS